MRSIYRAPLSVLMRLIIIIILRQILVNVGASPHTLPYLGIEIYHQQLQALGFHKKAKQVKKYIDKHCV